MSERKMRPSELARYRRIAAETDREFTTPPGEARLRRMALRRLAKLGPIQFPISIAERSGRLLGTIPGLPIREVGSTVRVVRDRITKRLNELAASDPFLVLHSVEEQRRETLTVEFKVPRVG